MAAMLALYGAVDAGVLARGMRDSYRVSIKFEVVSTLPNKTQAIASVVQSILVMIG